MNNLGKDSVSIFCEFCYGIGAYKCGRCRIASYCCKQHQIDHWSVHKKECIKLVKPDVAARNMNQYNDPSTNSLDFNITSEEELFSSLTSELLSSDNNFWSLINSCDPASISDYGVSFEKDLINELTGAEPVDKNSVANVSNSIENMSVTDEAPVIQTVPLDVICKTVVDDLNCYGICVLDKFLGISFGNLILQEVKNLYMSGVFKRGELVNPSPFSEESIRNDVTTWVDGSEPNCRYIASLMKKLDLVVSTCNRLPNNGILSNYKLHRRTKAMVACYPGDGTYYKKHVDNPHGDGRCITCIYYLNQNWDAKTQGGLLRMFPMATDFIANIEPIFDRMLFFWSDKRNPHEVLPAYSARFAITVWYFDADERDQALKMSRNRKMI